MKFFKLHAVMLAALLVEACMTQPLAAATEETTGTLSLEEDMTTGAQDARVVLVEFTDFQCPYCGDFHQEAFQKIADQYIATGKVRYAVRNFPMPMHPYAFTAAKVAMCAAHQNKFWEMEDKLFANQRALDAEDLVEYARQVGLDMNQFKDAVNSDEIDKAIRRHIQEGMKLGVNGTPTLFIGLAQPGEQVRIIEEFEGAQPFEAIQPAIEQALAKSESPDSQ